ncbi:hypothetical protein Gpo141_00000121 [Globisporangium polare]
MADAPANAGAGVGGNSSSASTADTCRTVLVIDGAYAHIGARQLEGNRIDYIKFRSVLELLVGSRLRECWFFDQEPILQRSSHQSLSTQYTALKLAPPHGPQFQLKLYAMKKYQCHCRQCGNKFNQMVQKGVDNGIATKILSLAYENIADRFILFAGDGDFYDSLNQIKNVLRKDLWVIGYRNTVSADLQQLASHVIWMNDLWPDVKMPGGTPANGRAPAARNESEDDEDGEVSDRGHDAPSRYQRKRTKDRKVQVTSQKAPPPSTAAPNDRQRRDRSRSRPRGGPQLQPADKDPGNLPLAALTVVSAQPALPQPPAKPSHYGEPAKGKPDAFGRDARPSQRTGVLGGPPGPPASALQANGHGKNALSRRIPTAPLTFPMSDISSSDDEDAGNYAAVQQAKRKQRITVIDLASDSDTTSN